MSQPRAAEEIAEWLALLIDAGQVFEVRALNCSTDSFRRPHSRAGYFDHPHITDAAAAALALTTCTKATGVYFTLNPLNPDLLARRSNRVDVMGREDRAAADADVICRRWILVDCDPVRVSGVSASQTERDAAREAATAIRNHFNAINWPDPLLADSGNGFHLLYRVDLPTDDAGLVRRCLHAIAAKFTTPTVSIDKSVFNPARICKLYGTFSRKGDSTPDRPHRRSRIIKGPSSSFDVVPMDLLQQLAAEAPPDKVQVRHASNRHVMPTVGDRVRAYLVKADPAVAGQHGHDTAWRIACNLVRGFSLSPEDALPFFAEWNQRCSPPWSERELEHKLSEAAAKADGASGYLLQSPHIRDELQAAYAAVDFGGGSATPTEAARSPPPRLLREDEIELRNIGRIP